MRTKLLSIFFVALMISGILAPLLLQGTTYTENNLNPTDFFELSSSSPTWHDDCSNTTGWYENTTNVENQIDKVQTGIALLTDANGLYSDIIPSASYNSHGPQYFKKLAAPMVLKDDLSLQVEIEHVGTSGSMGSVGIVLLDQNNDTFYKVGGVDGWVSSECNAWAGYRQDGSNVNMEYDTRSGAWTGSVRIWYDSLSDSIKTNVTGSEVTLASSGEFNPERAVHFVGLVFYLLQSEIYESHIVNDILITSSAPQSIIPSWHHDCSNTTAFDGVADDTWYGNPDIHIDGSIASIDGYIYADDYGSGSVSYGPMMYHTFSSPFNLSAFEVLAAEFEFDSSSASPMAAAAVVLFDEKNDTVIAINVADAWSGYNVVSAYALYDYANGTRFVTPYTNPTWTVTAPYREMITIIQNATGIYAFVPRVGNFEIISSAQIEPDRNISSIAVNFRAHATASISETNRIHEIYLNQVPVEVVEDTTDPIISSPLDIEFTQGDVGNIISWTITDLYPATYTIMDNDSTLMDSGLWSNGILEINVDSLSVGTHFVTVTAVDESMNSAQDTVIVTVLEDIDDISIDSPADIAYVVGTIGHNITWTPTSSTPATYQLYLGAEIIDSGLWNGSPLVVNVDGHTVGTYNYTMYVYNDDGAFDSNSVLVVVTDVSVSTTTGTIGGGGIGDILVIGISIGSMFVIVIIIGAICRNKGGEGGSTSIPSSGYEW